MIHVIFKTQIELLVNETEGNQNDFRISNWFVLILWIVGTQKWHYTVEIDGWVISKLVASWSIPKLAMRSRVFFWKKDVLNHRPHNCKANFLTAENSRSFTGYLNFEWIFTLSQSRLAKTYCRSHATAPICDNVESKQRNSSKQEICGSKSVITQRIMQHLDCAVEPVNRNRSALL